MSIQKMSNHEIWLEDLIFNQTQLSYQVSFISNELFPLQLQCLADLAEVSEDTKEAEKTAGNWIDEAVPSSDIGGTCGLDMTEPD